MTIIYVDGANGVGKDTIIRRVDEYGVIKIPQFHDKDTIYEHLAVGKAHLLPRQILEQHKYRNDLLGSMEEFSEYIILCNRSPLMSPVYARLWMQEDERIELEKTGKKLTGLKVTWLC